MDKLGSDFSKIYYNDKYGETFPEFYDVFVELAAFESDIDEDVHQAHHIIKGFLFNQM